MRGIGGHSKRRNTCGIASNSFSVLSVSFDSLAPARFTLQANLRLLYLKGPTFSIVVKSWCELAVVQHSPFVEALEVVFSRIGCIVRNACFIRIDVALDRRGPTILAHDFVFGFIPDSRRRRGHFLQCLHAEMDGVGV